MSSANPTRINEFNLNVTFLLTYVSILTICLFQSFKERLLLPIEATWWAAWAARFFCLQRPVLIGSAKVVENFYFTSFRRKNFSVFASSCLRRLPVEARCKSKKFF